MMLTLLLFGPSLVSAGTGEGPAVTQGVALELQGEIVGKGDNGTDNVSAIVSDADGGLLLIGADEGDQIQVFRKKKQQGHGYDTDEHACIALDPAVDQNKHLCSYPARGSEVDIEGIAWGKRYAYVVGSHSRARRPVEDFNKAGKPQTSLVVERARRGARKAVKKGKGPLGAQRKLEIPLRPSAAWK